MPRKDIDYSKTIIYKILCNDLTVQDCYVGHTTDFTKRKTTHKYSCNTESHHTYKYEVYRFIRENGGWSNWSMIECEKYPCNDSNEAAARERYWLESLNANLNTQIPNQSRRQYYEANIDEFKTRNKMNYELKKTENLQKIKEYRQNNQDKIKAYREANREEFNRKQNEKRAAARFLKESP